MRVISTLKTVWTCGLVRLDSTMRCAMMERILVMGTSSPGLRLRSCAAWQRLVRKALELQGFVASEGGRERRRASAALLKVAEDVGLGDATRCSGAGDLARSTLLSLAILRTSGEERRRSPDCGCGRMAECGLVVPRCAAGPLRRCSVDAAGAGGLSSHAADDGDDGVDVTVAPS